MSEWLAAFEGIDYAPDDAGRGRAFEEIIAPRLRNRIDTACVRVPIRTLYDIARRINAQSEEIARLQGVGEAIDVDRLAAFEREQEAVAEFLAAHTGVVVQDNGSGALYDRDGALTRADDYVALLTWCEENDWSVTAVDMPGVMGELDVEWPGDIVEVQKTYGALLREKRAAEVEAGRRAATRATAAVTHIAAETTG